MADTELDKTDCLYASCYCEENVYKLVEKMRSTGKSEDLRHIWVVFISNSDRCVPLWYQNAGREEDGLVVWDYHVILISKENSKTLVYDLDTKLAFPCDFTLYSEKSFGDQTDILAKFHRMFRVVTGEEYLLSFSSDRRHMKDGGQWLQPPPNWECIKGSKQEEHNLDSFINMDLRSSPGTVYSLDHFRNCFI